MSKVAIVYGSSGGATKLVAEKIQALLQDAVLFNAESLNIEDLATFDLLIFGTSTTGVGSLQDDWENLLPRIKKMNFIGKKLAIFGLGDSVMFSTSFVGAMYLLYEALKDKVKIVGAVSVDGYTFDKSDAVVNSRFVGLALDEDNEYEETDKRILAWVKNLEQYLV